MNIPPPPPNVPLPSAALPTGTRLDERYEVIDLLGAGGFALVYRARQLPINRLVALKVLAPPLDPALRASYHARFLREAQAAAQIHHPCSVAVHDYGIHQGSPYIAMELLEGHDLKVELERNGPMDPKLALPLLCGCLDALGEGHKRQIVHKDLKPSNLFLQHPATRRASLCILDFGVAHLGESQDGRATISGAVLGTPKYYAPEYAREQRVSPALDVYQMGLILVEMLTSQPVVSLSDPYACLLRHCAGALELPLALLESPLGPVLAKALALAPEARYPHAHALRDALEAVDPAQLPKLSAAPITRSLRDYSGSAKGLVSVALPGAAPQAPARDLDADEAQRRRSAVVAILAPTPSDDSPIDLAPYRKAEPPPPTPAEPAPPSTEATTLRLHEPANARSSAHLAALPAEPDADEPPPLDLSQERPASREPQRGSAAWAPRAALAALLVGLALAALLWLLGVGRA